METKSKDEKNLNKKRRKNLLKQKKSRIIVRNVSFKANEGIMRERFGKFGAIIEVNIPMKSNGKTSGFCFIGFNAIKSALKAIKHMNGTELLGRTIAVDFALAKKRFESHNRSEESVKSEDKDSERDSSDGNNGYDRTKHEVMETEVNDSGVDDIGGDNGEEDEELSGDEWDDNDFEGNDRKKSAKSETKIDAKILNDASEERTVFVRNLSFLTTAESLNEMMRQFGETEYCKLCIDKFTEHSKGSAFVKFKNKLDANKCLEAAEMENNSDLYLEGRQLTVSLAITRNKLKDLHENRFLKNKDKRNLYLAKEGLIYPDSPAAQGLSQLDLSKRLALETRKRKALQNNHYFVSQTRLCVHNIPLNYDNNQLRKLFITAVNDKSAKIIEARIMFDRKSDQKFGKSKGFGFVEFTDHSHALKALRHLNNNPNIFVPQKRPIVEFSIENKVALNKKKHRMKGNQQNNERQEKNIVENEETINYSGVQSRPNKQNEKIKTPKVNRKLGEMKKKLKIRGKTIKKNKMKTTKEKKHKQKVEKRKSNKIKFTETQDSHDLHYRKRKNIFKSANNSSGVVAKAKKVKWFTE